MSSVTLRNLSRFKLFVVLIVFFLSSCSRCAAAVAAGSVSHDLHTADGAGSRWPHHTNTHQLPALAVGCLTAASCCCGRCLTAGKEKGTVAVDCRTFKNVKRWLCKAEVSKRNAEWEMVEVAVQTCLKNSGILGLQLSIVLLTCEGGNFGYGGADCWRWKASWEKQFYCS